MSLLERLESCEEQPGSQPYLYESGIEANPFELKLGDYVYEDRVGHSGVVVVKDKPLKVEGTGHIVNTTTVWVTDPYVSGNPEAYCLVKKYVKGMEEHINQTGIDVLAERQKEHPYNGFNPRKGTTFTPKWVESSNVEALRNWRNMIPHACALGYLTLKQIIGASVPDSNGSQAEIKAETALQLRYVDDAVGIRDRAAGLRAVVLDKLRDSALTKDSPVSWLSLACGTAEPSVQAAVNFMEETGGSVDMHVFDYDQSALDLVEGVVSREGYLGSITTHCGDLLEKDYPKLIREVSSRRQFDVVENMGFEEYLPSEGDTMGAFKKLDSALPQASDFTRNAWDLVASGGMLVSGNMVLDRPQIDFVFGVVGWPIINARTEQEILRVYQRAGILDDPRARLTMHRVRNKDTGVCIYNIVTVEKIHTQIKH